MQPIEKLQKFAKADGQYHQTPWQAIYRSGGRGAAQYIQIDLQSSFSSHILIARQTFKYRLALQIGLSTELQTEDAAFNHQFSVDADDRQAALHLLNQTSLRRQLLLLFEKGIQEIQFTPTALIATLPNVQPKTLGNEAFDELLALLSSIVQITQASPDPLILSRPSLQKRRDRVLIISHILAFIVFVSGMSVMPKTDLQFRLLYLHSVGGSLPIVGLLIFLNFRRLRETVLAHETFFAQLWLILALWLSGTPGALSVLNQKLDHHPAQPYPSQVLSKSSEDYRGKTTYTLALQNPLASSNPLPWIVSAQDWNNLAEQAPVQLMVRPGALGYAWVEDVKLKPTK